MRDAAIIHYALFFKKNNDSSCALFEGRLRNAGIYTTVFSGWKTQLHLFTVNPPYLLYVHDHVIQYRQELMLRLNGSCECDMIFAKNKKNHLK